MTTHLTPIPDSERYRYEWFIDLAAHTDRGRLLVLGKNPSWPDDGNVCFAKTAAWARAHGFSSVDIANLFAYRARNPRELNGVGYDVAVGRDNDYTIGLLAADADLVIAAWGQPSGTRIDRYRRRVGEVVDLVGADRLTCLGTTKSGHPLHPQVWSSTLPIRDWTAG